MLANGRFRIWEIRKPANSNSTELSSSQKMFALRLHRRAGSLRPRWL
jgi:hypothetical protein